MKIKKELAQGFGSGELFPVLSDLVDDLNMMIGSAHRVAVAASLATATDATNEATAITLANDLKAKYNAHVALITSHFAADATNTVTSSNATDTATLDTLLNEIKGDYNAHRVLGTHVKAGGDTTNVVDAANATTTATAVTLANQIKAKYNAHVASAMGDLKTTK